MTDTNSTIEQLTPEEHAAAEMEGWGLFDSDGSSDGSPQIQRWDGAAILEDDPAAWRLVARRAAEGSLLHQKALRIVAAENPTEMERIRAA